MPSVAVTKMHGAQNDFVLIDQRSEPRVGDLSAFAVRMCDRRTGIGADGVLAIEPSARADARMRIFNADGSEAEMCGNGLRCAARYLSERGEGNAPAIETLSGIASAEIVSTSPQYLVRVSVGIPEFPRRTFAYERASFVVLGNPHVVIFEPDADAFDLEAAGQSLQTDEQFLDGTNVHVASVTGPNSLKVRHYERGVGFTQACGSGAASCAVAAIVRGDARSPVRISVPGGELTVEWDGRGAVFLTGPAERVFETSVPAHAAAD